MTTIAVDAMGGDFGPQVTLPACLAVLAEDPSLKIIVCGRESDLSPYSSHQSDALRFHYCQDVIGNDDAPASSLRHKKDSSLRKIIELVKDNQADGCVSGGNTGALMGLSRHLLKTHWGIDRPAIVTQIPGLGSSPWMLDLGANVDCNSDNLVQFALMGAALAEVNGKSKPRIALLNVGHEQNKGNEEVRIANQQLKEFDHLNYIGYIEGEGIFRGVADVVVCDGFVGNVALKTTEGLADLVSQQIQQALNKNFFYRLVGRLMQPILYDLKNQFDPQEKNGAILIGLQGIVVKSHGKANRKGFETAIKLAVKEARCDLNDRIAEKLEEIL